MKSTAGSYVIVRTATVSRSNLEQYITDEGGWFLLEFAEFAGTANTREKLIQKALSFFDRQGVEILEVSG